MIQKKSIVLISDTVCDANGVSRFIQDIARVAKQENKNFTVITSTSKTYCDTLENIKRLKPFIRFKMPFYPELDLVIPPFLKLYKEVKAKRPDGIHISTPGLVGFMGYLIAKRLKVPVYGTYHTDFASYLYSNTNSKIIQTITRFFENRFYRGCKGVFLRSDTYRGLIEDEFKIDSKKVFTIPAGINISHFSPTYRDLTCWEAFNLPNEALKVLYVGRVTTEKNIAFLLDLWQKNHNQNNNRWLILVGSGSFEKHAKTYESYNIKFLGHQDKEQLKTLYASSDLFIFPSNSDTLGQVVIEAIASGLPALVSDQGGPQTLISKELPNGYVLEKNSEERWINAINELSNDHEKRKRFSQNAYALSKTLSIEKSFELFWEKHSSKL
ncbi:MAG TPA: glycosyltransferase family 1 protein [Campylobacterales bacterium]|nr:glycosyltransferase family 1 protein [Campylobacterales bacterium]